MKGNSRPLQASQFFRKKNKKQKTKLIIAKLQNENHLLHFIDFILP